MSKSLISTGINPNDGNGDTLLSGATKINSNFNEVYSAIGDGSNINIGSGKTVLSTNSSGYVGVGTTNPTSSFQIYNGPVVAGTSSSTGTLNQRLQVFGDAYVSGNVGLGTTNPITQHHVVGNQYITGITTVGLANTSLPPSNSQMSFELLTNTKLRIKVKGTDGVLRMVDLTLS